jgi:hypothetical protein
MAIDEGTVRERAQALCDALLTGDVEKATEDVSDELRRNLGEVVALLPLPANEAVIDSVERGASAFVVVLRVAGETDETMIQTRWKDRDGKPTIVEASHLSQTALAAPATGAEEPTDDAAATPG